MTAAAAAVGLDSATGGAADLARRLANGEIIAVFDGASEIGPRALGGRSILADPRQANIREVLNRTIKHREPFRPLAPIVLSEHFDEYFTPATAANEFMLVIADATELCKRAAPSTVHVDGTARVQVVPADESIFVRRVLASFHDLTGVPVLLNTSFNRRGEPIVETPDQAVAAFLDMGLDGMWLDGLYIFVPPADHTPVAAG
jgi:carbamoyltransferase